MKSPDRQPEIRHRYAGKVTWGLLGDTEDGDVFFLESDPSCVWACKRSRVTGYPVFLRLGGDAWRTGESVGDPGEPCIVLHNTKLRFGVAAPGEGG